MAQLVYDIMAQLVYDKIAQIVYDITAHIRSHHIESDVIIGSNGGRC